MPELGRKARDQLPDGAFAYNGMVDGGNGTFFGATVHGGAGDDGAIYQFTP